MIDPETVKYGDVFVSKAGGGQFMFVAFSRSKTAVDGGWSWYGLPLHLVAVGRNKGVPQMRSFNSDRWVRR